MHDCTDGRPLCEKAINVSIRMVRAQPIAQSMTATAMWICLVLPALGGNLDPSAIDNAQFSSKPVSKNKLDPAVIRAEFFLIARGSRLARLTAS